MSLVEITGEAILERLAGMSDEYVRLVKATGSAQGDAQRRGLVSALGRTVGTIHGLVTLLEIKYETNTYSIPKFDRAQKEIIDDVMFVDSSGSCSFCKTGEALVDDHGLKIEIRSGGDRALAEEIIPRLIERDKELSQIAFPVLVTDGEIFTGSDALAKLKRIARRRP